MLHKRTTHISRTVGTVAGSGKKPHPQKKTGRARQGNKRAPGRKKCGKAHGAKPRDFTYTIPKKIRLLALKTMLSARLAEGKLRLVDTERIDSSKTKNVSAILKQFDEKITVLLVTGYKADENFEVAQRNIARIEIAKPHTLTVNKILSFDKLVITKDGVQSLIQELQDRSFLRFRPRKVNREMTPSENARVKALGVVVRKQEIPKYDPSQPLKFKFKILEEYLKEYEKKQSGEVLEQKTKTAAANKAEHEK